MAETATSTRTENRTTPTEASVENAGTEVRSLTDKEIEETAAILAPEKGDVVRVFSDEIEQRPRSGWTKEGGAWYVTDVNDYGDGKLYGLRRNIDDVNSEATTATAAEVREWQEQGSNYKIGEEVKLSLDSDGNPANPNDEGWRVVTILTTEDGKNEVIAAKMGSDSAPITKRVPEEVLDQSNPTDYVTHFKLGDSGEWIAYLSDRNARGKKELSKSESRPILVKNLLARDEPFKGVSRETLESLSTTQEGTRADFTTPAFQEWMRKRREPGPSTAKQNAEFFSMDPAAENRAKVASSVAEVLMEKRERVLEDLRYSDPDTSTSIRGLARYVGQLSKKISAEAGSKIKEFGLKRPDVFPENTEQVAKDTRAETAEGEPRNSDAEAQVSIKGLGEYIRDLSKEKSGNAKARVKSARLARQAKSAAIAAGLDYDTKENSLSQNIPTESERKTAWEFKLGQEVDGPKWTTDKARLQKPEWHVTKRFIDQDGHKMVVVGWKDKKGKYHNFAPISELELKGWQKPGNDSNAES